MALTQNEERADKISAKMSQEIDEGVAALKSGKSHTFHTGALYKERDGLATSSIKVNYDKESDRVLIVRTVVNPNKPPQDYTSAIQGTKTKLPIDCLATKLKSKITKKLRDAWSETPLGAKVNTADTLKKPMLLHKWEKQKKKIQYPCIMQPKKDGIRGMYDSTTGKLYSRSGKVVLLPHITDQLNARDLPSLDGEICYEDHNVPLPEVIHGIAHADTKLRFYAFDVVRPGSYKDRFIGECIDLVESVGDAPSVEIIASRIATCEAEVDAYYKECADAGMEGIVVRNVESEYKYGGRSMEVLKYKVEFEGTYAVLGVSPVPHPEGDLMMFICKTAAWGHTFEVTPAWKHEERRKFKLEWDKQVKLKGNPLVSNGAQILVEYRSISADKKPLHAVGKTKYKDMVKFLRP
jgi:ATP-dependent DNA ligase